MTGRLFTLGEAMVLLSPTRTGPLRHATSLSVGTGGAEANVAIGVCRLGDHADWVGRVGADELGDLVVSRLRGEGVGVRDVVRDPGAPTSLMIREQRTSDTAAVHYYRRGGPGSRLSPADVPAELVERADVVHLSGITAGLSAGALATLHAVVDAAAGHGTTVSLDINYRRALWSPDAAAPALRGLAERCHVLFAGQDEAELLGFTGSALEQGRGILALGPLEVVVKRGAAGATAVTPTETIEMPAITVTAVDTVGAGDAFVAGHLHGLMDGAGLAERLRLGVRCGAVVASTQGDWEGFPSTRELAALPQETGTVLR
jgi:2-dehydro-3-deoxygluconokinase